MLHIQQEINDQPEVLKRLLAEESNTARKIANVIRDFDPAFVHIAARGTSDNAGRYAQYLMGVQAHFAVGLATPSVHTLYEAAPNLSKALVVGISQSGQAEDVCRVLADARAQGGLTVAISNDANSPLAQTAAYHLPLCAGEEVSGTATKTYTAQLTALAMLVTALLDNAEMQSALERIPDLVAETLEYSELIAGWGERYRYMNRFAVIGRGYNYCTAFEISLKIKELCYVTGVEYSEADFRYGPIALIQPGFPVIAVAPMGKTLPHFVDLLEKLRSRQAECLVISNSQTALGYAQNGMPLPIDLPEWLAPIAAVVPGQVFAVDLAVAQGHPVDRRIGLTNLMVTA